MLRIQVPQHSLLLELEFKNLLFFAKISLTKGTARTFIANQAIFCWA